MSGIMRSKTPRNLPFNKKSLNKIERKKHLEKIAGDNVGILRRLQCKTPVYSIAKWEQEWKVNEQRMKNMQEFPSQSMERRIRVNLTQAKSSSSKNILFKKGCNIDNKYFLVEVSKKRNDDLKIILYDPNISESFSLEIDFHEALEFMGGKEDYSLLISHFHIKGDEIILGIGKEQPYLPLIL